MPLLRSILAEERRLSGVGEDLQAFSQGLLVVELGFGERDDPFVAVFFHFVLLLFAGVFFLFALLRFEANFGFALFGS